LDDGAEILGRYDKARLVPFGEKIPLRNIIGKLGLQPIVPGTMDYQEGPGMRTLNVDGIPGFEPLICYEIIFSGAILEKGSRPDWILNITNDAWFGNSAGPYQHFQMARARAVEEGVPVIRVAGTGISAVIDPYGRVLASLPLNSRGILDARIPGRIDQKPLFAAVGRGLGFALIILFFAIGASSGRSDRPEKRRTP